MASFLSRVALALLVGVSSTSLAAAAEIAVEAGDGAAERLTEALITAKPGDTVRIGAGRFDLTDGLFALHVIDVGQSEGLLLKYPDGRAALVDAGVKDAGPEVCAYIREVGVRSLALVVGT